MGTTVVPNYRDNYKKGVYIKNKALPFCASALLLFSAGARAADNTTDPSINDQPSAIFVGGTLGISHTQDVVDNTTKLMDNLGAPGGTVEGNQAAGTAGLYVGIDASKNVGVRMGYVNLGEYTAKVNMPTVPFNGKMDFNWYAYTFDLLIKAPLQVSQSANPTSVFLKLGVAATRNDWQLSGGFGNASGTDKKTIFVPGVGVKIDTSSHLSVAFEADYYADLASSESGYNFNLLTMTGGLFYRF